MRELDLRGNKIPAIENLSATNDLYDYIDLTDNDLRILENFPVLYRLKILCASNNLISKIDADITSKIPNLQYLILINNQLESVSNIIALSRLKNLKHLVLLDNPISTIPNYRKIVLKNLPNLKSLDFVKVTQKVMVYFNIFRISLLLGISLLLLENASLQTEM